MRQLIHSAFIDNVLKGLEGITLGAVIFFAGALMMAAISTNVDTEALQHKIANAIHTAQIQYPGKFDLDDRRGSDTFEDCTVFQFLIMGASGTICLIQSFITRLDVILAIPLGIAFGQRA